MNTASNLVKSSIARTAFMVVSMATGFFMMPFLVAHLGERWYGIWILLAGLLGNAYLLDFGLATAVTRFVAKHLSTDDRNGINEVVNTCLAIYSVLALVVLLAAAVVGVFAERFVHNASEMTVIRATILVLGFQYAAEFPFKSFAGIIGSYLRYDRLVLSRLLNLALTTGFSVYFVRHGHGILTLAVIVFLVDQLSNWLYYRIAKHLFPDLAIATRFVRRRLVRELFSYSAWSFVIQVANQFRFRIDSLVIASMMSVNLVTYYAVGLRLVEYFVEFVYKATNMMTPVFTAYYFRNECDELRRKYLMVTRLNAILALGGGGMIVILGKAFIVRWMGPGFGVSYPVLVVLTVAMTAELIGTHSDNILYAVSRHKYLAIVNTVEGLANLALSVALAQPFGIFGVAVGTAIPLLAFRLFVIPYYVGRFIGLRVSKFYWNLLPVAAFAVAYLSLFALAVQPFLVVPSYPTLVVASLIGGPLYLIPSSLVGLSKVERRQMVDLLPDRMQRIVAPLLRVVPKPSDAEAVRTGDGDAR